MQVTISVNGTSHTDHVEPRTLLVHYLRDMHGLRATNTGCDTTSCGACTVLVDGESVKSCTVLAAQADGTEVTTLEGLSPLGGPTGGATEAGTLHPVESHPVRLHPVAQAFRDEHALQCGFCTPGMVMAAVALLRENPHPSAADVRHGLEGNLCRCTGYQNIVRAVLRAADHLSDGPTRDDHRRDGHTTDRDAGPDGYDAVPTEGPSA